MTIKKTAIVTGATGAIGTAIARQLLTTGQHKVIMLVKDEEKASRILKQIVKETGQNDISWAKVDLSRKKQIFDFATSFSGPLHVLVNNAACTPRQREETPEGIEMQWATNVLGYFWLMVAFEKHLKEGTPSRIVNVASYWAGDLDLDDLEFMKRRYHNDTAYRQSKQANRMLTVAFADRLNSDGVTVNACHPGDVKSKLSNNLGYGGYETPDQGARTPVWLATAPEVEGISGKYFADRREETCYFSRDRKAIDRLVEICSGY
jgi:NAD(P)-dependent dehydrogenase (short-subunit alcohol dehydrogenase family)